MPRPAAVRRPALSRDLARGPGRLGDAVGLRHPIHDGIDAITGAERHGAVARLLLRREPSPARRRGRASGVAGVAGTDAFPWRFWIAGDPTVSPFRWGRGAGPAPASLAQARHRGERGAEGAHRVARSARRGR